MSDNFQLHLESIQTKIREGVHDVALAEIGKSLKDPSLIQREKLLLKIEKARVLLRQGKVNESLDLSEKVLSESISFGNSLLVIDALFAKIEALISLKLIDKSQQLLEKGNQILRKISGVPKAQLQRRIGLYYYYSGLLNEKRVKKQEALNDYLRALTTQREADFDEDIVDTLNATARVYYNQKDVIRALMIYRQALDVSKKIANDALRAQILNNIGTIYVWQADYGPALEYCLQSLALSREKNIQESLAAAQYNISLVYYALGELNRALSNLEESLSIFDDVKKRLEIAQCLDYLSRIFIQKGELDRAHMYQEQSQDILETIDNKVGLAASLKTKGLILFQKGDLNNALESFYQSLIIRENHDDKRSIASILFWLIRVAIEKNELSEAQSYLQRLQRVADKKKNAIIKLYYRLATALFLKTSLSQQILDKAKEILKNIVNSEMIDNHLSNIALFALCELLLDEYQIFGDKSSINETNQYLKKHLAIAKQLESHAMFAENFWLKARYAYAQNDIDEAKLLLLQAEQITDEKSFLRLGFKISSLSQSLESGVIITPPEQNEESIRIESEPSDRDDEIVRMFERRDISLPKLKQEEPILLLIVYEGGVTIFSKKFSHKEMIDEMFIGGFLAAIDAFMHQTFATGGSIERIKHQEYTLLMKVENPLLFCYVYKGHSFSAIQKLDSVTRELMNAPTIWQALVRQKREQLTQTEYDFISELAEEIFVSEEID